MEKVSVTSECVHFGVFRSVSECGCHPSRLAKENSENILEASCIPVLSGGGPLFLFENHFFNDGLQWNI
jgi:hypothetical protein